MLMKTKIAAEDNENDDHDDNEDDNDDDDDEDMTTIRSIKNDTIYAFLKDNDDNTGIGIRDIHYMETIRYIRS